MGLEPAPPNAVAGDEQAAVDIAVPEAPPQRAGLLRNTAYLTLAQAVTIPVSVITNAAIGRYLSAEEFGYLYLAGTLCGFAMMAVEWGQQGAIPALIARDRSRAGSVLGTSLVWRTLIAVPVAVVVAGLCVLLGYGSLMRAAVALTFVGAFFTTCASAYKDAIRGFERADIPAYAHVAQQLGALLIVFPVLAGGGGLQALLVGYLAVSFGTLVYVHRSLRAVGVTRLEAHRSSVRPLLSLGTPFVFFGLAMALLPNVNALFLSKLVPASVVGAYSVSQRLIGLLIFPASALIGALYPTLCRLHVEDRDGFVRTSQGALYGVSLLAIPAAVGCGLFPELGVMIFGSEKYHGAEDHLRLMSVFVFLVYFSMPLGTAILAANRQKVWALVQCLCIVVALIGNPLFVPWFQAKTGNGALGTCLSLVISEVLVVACGIALTPRAVFDRKLGKSLLLAALAGAAMAAVAHFTKPISLYLAVPAALATYLGLAWFTGAIQASTVDMVKGFLARKFSRAR